MTTDVRAILLGIALFPLLLGTARAVELDPSLGALDENTDLIWFDARHLGLEGKGWTETLAYYDRLPARAEQLVRAEVWSLSRHSAGLCVRFTTNAPAIHARWTLTSNSLAMPHMPATGVSGLDLYVRTDDGSWRWLAVGQPTKTTNTVELVRGLTEDRREYLLYLPLYNGVKSLEIGIPRDHSLAKAPPRPAERQKPIVFYGTSITQGGCASRPGMVHTAILGRWLDYPVINLGFSGNGRMEAELAQLLAEIDAAVYVIDCLPNLNASQVRERTVPLVRILRDARPHVPIVLVEDRNYTDGFLVPHRRARNEENHQALREAYAQLRAEGVTDLFYVPGDDLLGEDGEGTVDGSHPTDLGFWRQAQVLRDVLAPIVSAK